MSSVQEKNKAIVARFNKEFIEGHHDDLFWETVSPDFVNRSAEPGKQGRDGAWAWFTQGLRKAFPDMTVTVEDQFAEDDVVVTRKTYVATHQGAFLGVEPTGRKVSFGVIDIIRLADGKYVEHWAGPDMFQLYQQITAP